MRAVSEPDWFRGAGLGLFVHWDPASQLGLEIGWPIAGEVHVGGRPFRELFEAIPHVATANVFLGRYPTVSLDDYNAAARTFDPQQWDAADLARRARRAGARYAVFTTKHHGGYCMFPTSTSRHSVEHSPCARDLVGEYVEAMRAEGLRVGFYFSLADWSHPDYPPLTPDLRPYRFGHSPPFPGEERWQRFRSDLLEQLRELLTRYGRIDLLWFDGGWERSIEQWGSDEIESLIRSLQPEIRLNDRLPGVAGYATPEQFVPARPIDGPWEVCLTMGESWGFDRDDNEPKPAAELLQRLCEVVSRGGNLLLNVSPTGNGALPPAQIERLDALAGWMERHAESVIGVEPGLEPWQFYGPSTRRDRRVHLFCFGRPEAVSVRGVPLRGLRAVTALGSGRALDYRVRPVFGEVLTGQPSGELAIALPPESLDPLATVIALDWEPPAS